MNRLLTLASAGTLALAASFGAHATMTTVDQFDQWYAFDVDDLSALSGGTEWIDIATNFGETLSFTFTLAQPAVLRVVDGGHAGDRFTVAIASGSSLELHPLSSFCAGSPSACLPTSAATDSYPATADLAAAWADANYSRLTVELAPGSYTVTGSLLQAAGGGAPLNVTTGGLMLSPVPEASTWMLLLAGLGLLGVATRRRG